MSKSFPVAILLLRTSSPWAKSTWIAGSQPWCDSWSELLFGWNESFLLQVSGCSIEHPAPIQNCSHNNSEQWGRCLGRWLGKARFVLPYDCHPMDMEEFGRGLFNYTGMFDYWRKCSQDGGKAQSVKCVLFKYEDLSSGSRAHVSLAAHDSNPSTRKVETGRTLRLSGQLA